MCSMFSYPLQYFLNVLADHKTVPIQLNITDMFFGTDLLHAMHDQCEQFQMDIFNVLHFVEFVHTLQLSALVCGRHS